VRPAAPAVLADADFKRISRLVRRLCGIDLQAGKKPLVSARLGRRLRVLGLSDFDAYLRYLESDATHNELAAMVDALTTNVTSFFREPAHFDFLRGEFLERHLQRDRRRRLRLWSAGCATGEEPYSVAMTLLDAIPQGEKWDLRILATDLSRRVISHAARGAYPSSGLADVPPRFIERFFEPLADGRPGHIRVRAAVRRRITFARLNLIGPWPMKGPFDLLLCRNVMIYFDRELQQRMVDRFRRILAPGGFLLLGHSESLAGHREAFRYVQPTIYERL
jgi:chemotaxis protein methyltransferase CheR